MIIILMGATLSLNPRMGVIEKLSTYLKGSGVTAAALETEYSCLPLQSVIEQGLIHLKKRERDIISQRRGLRASALLPEITAWGRYKSDDKIYLYQQNNISVGKDYITVGPDDMNTTFGDFSSWEIGGRVKFNLSRLISNPTVGRFVEQERSLQEQRIHLIDKISSTYFLIAIIKALRKNKINPSESIMTQAEIAARTGNAWFISIGGEDLIECTQPIGE